MFAPLSWGAEFFIAIMVEVSFRKRPEVIFFSLMPSKKPLVFPWSLLLFGIYIQNVPEVPYMFPPHRKNQPVVKISFYKENIIILV